MVEMLLREKRVALKVNKLHLYCSWNSARFNRGCIRKFLHFLLSLFELRKSSIIRISWEVRLHNTWIYLMLTSITAFWSKNNSFLVLVAPTTLVDCRCATKGQMRPAVCPTAACEFIIDMSSLMSTNNAKSQIQLVNSYACSWCSLRHISLFISFIADCNSLPTNVFSTTKHPDLTWPIAVVHV